MSTSLTSTRQKQLAIWVGRYFRLESIPVTRWLSQHYGNLLGLTYVGGYPKSGTTWVADMIGHYLDIPRVDYNYLPAAMEQGLVHHHWDYHPDFDRSFQVIRDGRDVMVSLYMNLVKGYVGRLEGVHSLTGRDWPISFLINHTGEFAILRKRLRHLYGPRFDPWNIGENLPRFIEEDFRRPFTLAVRHSWSDYVRSWRHQGRHTVFIKYEEMLSSGKAALANALERYLGAAVNESNLAYTLQRYSFKQKTGRDPGVENRNEFARKGIQGDWKNHFSADARRVFDQCAGDLLIELGYESDRRWVDQ